MAVELEISGFVGVIFLHKDGSNEVSKPTEKKILENLKSGDFVMGLDSKYIFDLSDLTLPLYRVQFDNTEGVEYNWHKL